jgi:hypothetical protein
VQEAVDALLDLDERTVRGQVAHRALDDRAGRVVLLDQVLRGFDAALRFWLSTVVVPQGSRVGVVDLYTASLGRTGLVMLDRRNGENGGFDFDPHPTTLGHELIAREFERAWTTLSGN